MKWDALSSTLAVTSICTRNWWWVKSALHTFRWASAHSNTKSSFCLFSPTVYMKKKSLLRLMYLYYLLSNPFKVVFLSCWRNPAHAKNNMSNLQNFFFFNLLNGYFKIAAASLSHWSWPNSVQLIALLWSPTFGSLVPKGIIDKQLEHSLHLEIRFAKNAFDCESKHTHRHAQTGTPGRGWENHLWKAVNIAHSFFWDVLLWLGPGCGSKLLVQEKNHAQRWKMNSLRS